MAQARSAELLRLHMPLRRPMTAAHGTETHRDVILVRLITDDAEGWGECSALARPTYTGEYTAGAWAVLAGEILPAVLSGRRPDVVGHPMAAAAVRAAMADCELRARGRSLAEELGAAWRPLLRTQVVGTGDAAEVEASVVAALETRPAAVKVKIAPGADLEVLRALRRRWPGLSIAADANGSYSGCPGDLEALDGLGLAYIEQPLAADELVASARLASRMATPIALDESATSPGLVEAALELGAGSVVNVKPARLGGLGPALACAELARSRGASCFVGGMLETGVGRAAAAALGCHERFDLPTDLGPSNQYFVTDVTAEIGADAEGRLEPPTGPGIGVIPDAERLGEFVVERREL